MGSIHQRFAISPLPISTLFFRAASISSTDSVFGTYAPVENAAPTIGFFFAYCRMVLTASA